MDGEIEKRAYIKYANTSSTRNENIISSKVIFIFTYL